MGLDHGYTCPIIDKGIESFKLDLRDHLDDMVHEICSLLEGLNTE